MMEMNRRRSSRGFMIAKLMPFCKAVKPPSPSQDLYNNVHYASNSTTNSYAPQPAFSNYETATPLPPRVVVFLQPPQAPEGKDMDKRLNMLTKKLIGVDESVDARAASYISSVRERFKLDHSETTTIINIDEDVDR